MATATMPDTQPGLLPSPPEALPESYIPVEVYLRTTYHPDQEYIDGHLLERNLGEIPHSRLQGFFAWIFRQHEAEWKVSALPEQRVQVAPDRYRIPDICIIPLRTEDKRIVRSAPLLCIEVLSWDDRMGEMQERVDDYLRMGVRAVWIVDPRRRRAFLTTPDGVVTPVADKLVVSGTAIEVAVSDIFNELDRYEQPETEATPE